MWGCWGEFRVGLLWVAQSITFGRWVGRRSHRQRVGDAKLSYTGQEPAALYEAPVGEAQADRGEAVRGPGRRDREGDAEEWRRRGSMTGSI